MMKPDSPLTADVDRQLTLLRLAARVDPNLRQAVADVEDAIATLRTQLEALMLEYNASLEKLGAAHIENDRLEARETALREALEETVRFLTMLAAADVGMLRCSDIQAEGSKLDKIVSRALSGEGSNQP